MGASYKEIYVQKIDSLISTSGPDVCREKRGFCPNKNCWKNSKLKKIWNSVGLFSKYENKINKYEKK